MVHFNFAYSCNLEGKITIIESTNELYELFTKTLDNAPNRIGVCKDNVYGLLESETTIQPHAEVFYKLSSIEILFR